MPQSYLGSVLQMGSDVMFTVHYKKVSLGSVQSYLGSVLQMGTDVMFTVHYKKVRKQPLERSE